MIRTNDSLPCFDVGIPTRIVFGAGALEKLARLPFPGKRCLIVATRGQSIRRTGTLARVEALLAGRGIETVLFDRCRSNPVLEDVEEGVELCRSASVDVVLGLGGGSALDCAKAISLAAPNTGSLWNYVRGGSGKGLKPAHKPLPVVAIPTTAGTGSEANPWAVVTNLATREKIGFGTRDTYPVLSIVDPELLRTVPADFTAWQGFDALSHAIEGFLCTSHNVLSDLWALEAVRRLAKSLPIAVTDGGNLAARTDTALASTLAGLVEATSNCLSAHSIEHALSAMRPELVHGRGLLLIAHSYHEHLIRKGAAPERYVALARALGRSEAEEPADFLSALGALQTACGLRNDRLSDAGFAREDLPEVARIARSSMGHLFRGDPVEVTDEDVLAILEHAL